jgi:hypothetical protein
LELPDRRIGEDITRLPADHADLLTLAGLAGMLIDPLSGVFSMAFVDRENHLRHGFLLSLLLISFDFLVQFLNRTKK